MMCPVKIKVDLKQTQFTSAMSGAMKREQYTETKYSSILNGYPPPLCIPLTPLLTVGQ